MLLSRRQLLKTTAVSMVTATIAEVALAAEPKVQPGPKIAAGNPCPGGSPRDPLCLTDRIFEDPVTNQQGVIKRQVAVGRIFNSDATGDVKKGPGGVPEFVSQKKQKIWS